MKKIIIFDMDGTLYNFKEGSFKDSAFRKKVLSNVKEFIKDRLQKNEEEAILLLQ
jgi:FMN phosphatase YigB (HAD superfamily)